MTRKQPQHVLLIDDDPMIYKLVQLRLRDLGVKVTYAETGTEGLAIASKLHPDLVLLDVTMPDMDGFEVCRKLRGDPLTCEVPVIFLTGSEQSEEKVRGFELGAVDYVLKPFDAAELRARVRTALRQQALVEALESQVRTDNLTGLLNREAFRAAIIRSIERSRRESTYRFAVLFMDLDRFKVINDSLGHAVGDELLVHVANELYRCVRGGTKAARKRSRDAVARLGGDEFAVLLDDIPDIETVEVIATRIRDALREPLTLSGYQVNVTASIGIRICQNENVTADDLLRDGDTAMYHAKASGKDHHVIFTEEMHRKVADRLQLEHDLRCAVKENQLILHYQPLIALEDGQLYGFEALLRWKHPDRGLVLPETFIPIAEETGLILEIGSWVLRQASQQLAAWLQQFPVAPGLVMSVNLSKVQLSKAGLVNEVRLTLGETGLDPSLLELELTESSIMHDLKLAVPIFDQIRALGVRVAMDDFGTGYSSLALLHRLPIDVLKIDQTFIQRMDDSRPFAAIVQAIVTLAQNLGMQVIAEGIEKKEHLAALQALECDFAQGFYFSRPMAVEDVERMLAERFPRAKSA